MDRLVCVKFNEVNMAHLHEIRVRGYTTNSKELLVVGRGDLLELFPP